MSRSRHISYIFSNVRSFLFPWQKKENFCKSFQIVNATIESRGGGGGVEIKINWKETCSGGHRYFETCSGGHL
jgi:hypothetical protein